jgi:hypothetical protein
MAAKGKGAGAANINKLVILLLKPGYNQRSWIRRIVVGYNDFQVRIILSVCMRNSTLKKFTPVSCGYDYWDSSQGNLEDLIDHNFKPECPQLTMEGGETNL